jgi:hypothetical protein
MLAVDYKCNLHNNDPMLHRAAAGLLAVRGRKHVLTSHKSGQIVLQRHAGRALLASAYDHLSLYYLAF